MRLGFFLILLIVQTTAKASNALLNAFFTQVNTLQAEFQQTVVDETGMTLERSSGVFYLSRPGKFRWSYVNGNEVTENEAAENKVAIHGAKADALLESGQQIIADGESIFMYDPDLEQVTKRSMREALLQVPSLILVQDLKSDKVLDELFEITNFGMTDGESWVALKPKSEDASYRQLLIGFLENSLASIVLLDGLGNETRLRLSAVTENIAIDSSVFKFEVPVGADVLVE